MRSLSKKESDVLFAEIQSRLKRGETYHVKREEIQNGPFGVCEEEKDAIMEALAAGRSWGYGNMISWLEKEWDRMLAASEILRRKKRSKTSSGEVGGGD